jgi:hypothetical protein
MFWNKQESPIRFLCNPRYKGIIPEPFPAKKFIPDWYKRMESYFNEQQSIRPVPTLKRCPPVLDAFSAGWIIPLAAEVHLQIRDGGTGISWDVDFPEPIIENHKLGQISTHPSHPKVPLKILNQWLIETAPGWSCLFVSPLNRIDEKLDLLSGIVETDKYFEYVNFPGFVKMENGYQKLERGHPLMQVIPFKRDYNKDMVIDSFSKDELNRLQQTRDRKAAEFSYYRDNLWEKKI